MTKFFGMSLMVLCLHCIEGVLGNSKPIHLSGSRTRSPALQSEAPASTDRKATPAHPSLSHGLQHARTSAWLPRLQLRGGCASDSDEEQIDAAARAPDDATADADWMQEAPERISLPDMEEAVLRYWDEADVFNRSVAAARAEGPAAKPAAATQRS